MKLLTAPNCPFCDKIIKDYGDYFDSISTTVVHPDGTVYIQLDELTYQPLPGTIKGLPALIDGDRVYVGAKPIIERMEENSAHTV